MLFFFSAREAPAAHILVYTRHATNALFVMSRKDRQSVFFTHLFVARNGTGVFAMRAESVKPVSANVVASAEHILTVTQR